LTYEADSTRRSNRVLIALVVITIAVVAFWAVSGGLESIQVTEGQTATVEVTFYDAAGAVMGVEQAMVQIPATDAQAAFRVEVDTEQYVGGYSYEITL